MIKPRKNTHSALHSKGVYFFSPVWPICSAHKPSLIKSIFSDATHHFRTTDLFKSHHCTFSPFLKSFARKSTLRQVPLSLKCNGSDSNSLGSVSSWICSIKVLFQPECMTIMWNNVAKDLGHSNSVATGLQSKPAIVEFFISIHYPISNAYRQFSAFEHQNFLL